MELTKKEIIDAPHLIPNKEKSNQFFLFYHNSDIIKPSSIEFENGEPKYVKVPCNCNKQLCTRIPFKELSIYVSDINQNPLKIQ